MSKIYLLIQEVNGGYDTYDSCVVCAKNEEEAKLIHPNGTLFKEYEVKRKDDYGSWASKFDEIKCLEIGTANDNQKIGLILSSFNAG